MSLSVSPTKAKADIHEQSWEDIDSPRDLDYRSRGQMAYARFGELIVEETMLTGGKVMRDGGMGGFARVEGEAEGGFFQYKFVCKAK